MISETSLCDPSANEPLRSYKDLLEMLAIATHKADVTVALLLVNVQEVSLVQARLGFAASTALFRQISQGFSQTIATRGTVIRLGDGSFGIIIDTVRNRGDAVLAGQKLLRVADGLTQAGRIARTAGRAKPEAQHLRSGAVCV